MNNELAAKNTKLAMLVKVGTPFQLVHKNHTHFENEPDGYWVSAATPDSKVGYYDMVLVDLTVDELRDTGCQAFGTDLLIEEGTPAYAVMVSNWIPLPVLFEQLGLHHNFKDYNDLSVARTTEMIKSKLLVPGVNGYTNRKAVMTKKCGHMVAA